MKKVQKKYIQDILLWYKKNGRILPWRTTQDPYHILISEVMLQQTQVDRVVEKYKEFLTLFLTVDALANAKTADVIRAWKGLGYNRRALFLKKSAEAVCSVHNGEFPKTIETLKQLPGIGDYTARAILSFSFDKPIPVLDTNHRKIYQRFFFGENQQPDRVLLTKAEHVVSYIQEIDPHSFGLSKSNTLVYHWNQALMDFGTALARKEKDSFVQTFADTFSEPKKVKKRKKAVPFEQTDRYIRGRIVDLLREKQAKKEELYAVFPQFPENRIIRVLESLEKEGFIQKKRVFISLM